MTAPTPPPAPRVDPVDDPYAWLRHAWELGDLKQATLLECLDALRAATVRPTQEAR